MLDILLRGLHDKATAKTFFRELFKGLGFEHVKRKILAIFSAQP
jgi:hypothetical protein